MALINERLPAEVERGVIGGPMFQTSIIDFSSGHEQRNADWANHRGKWNASYGIMYIRDPDEAASAIQAVRSLFYVCRGRQHSFRFKDWADYIVEGELLGVGELLGGSPAVKLKDFPLKVAYEAGVETYVRSILHPVQNSIKIYIDDVLQPDNRWTFANGIISFINNTVAPNEGQAVTADFQFDNEVRFDTDHLQISVEAFNAGTLPDIPLIEVRPDEDA